jgi:hypothetical protein
MVLASESERKTSFGLPGYLNVEGRLTLNDPGKKWKGTRANAAPLRSHDNGTGMYGILCGCASGGMTWATQYHDGPSPRALRTLVSCQVPHHRLPSSDCTSVSCVTAEPTTLCLQRNDFPFLNGSQVSPLATRHPLNRYRVDVKSWQGCCVLAPDGRRMLRYKCLHYHPKSPIVLT